MSTNLKLPIGIDDFSEIKSGGFAYIDKTRLIYDLVKSGCYYLLCRPKLFGKSLLISTLKYYFLGKKELFKETELYNLEMEWTEYPVLYLNFDNKDYYSTKNLNTVLMDFLSQEESKYGIISESIYLGARLASIIEKAYNVSGKRVVILVDEYDKPVIQPLFNTKIKNKNYSILSGFYETIKSCDKYIEFVLMTGVAKIGNNDMFNNLDCFNDISMDSRYYDICGCTESEIHSTFSNQVDAFANIKGISSNEAYDLLKEYYGGYHFNEDDENEVYNVYNILNALNKKKIGFFWVKTRNQKQLNELLRKNYNDKANLNGVQTTEDALHYIDSFSTDIIPYLYQNGYLTIKGFDSRFKLCKLGYPNREIAENLQHLF